MNRSNQFSWQDARIFLAVLDTKSFSGAAKALRLGQPTISRRVQQLEERFSVQLFVRGKHGAKPTLQAELLRLPAEQMARWAKEFQQSIEQGDHEISGKVTIAAPPGVAVEQLAPFSAILKKTHPDLTLEVLSSVDHINLSRGSADLAIRMNAPTDPELVALYTCHLQTIVAGSSQYVARLKQPCSWQDLDWICWGGQYQHLAPRPLLEKSIPGFSPTFSSDDYLTQKAATVAGMGVMMMYRAFGLEPKVLTEIELLKPLPMADFYLVCAKSTQHVPRVAAVAEALIDVIKRS
jgi:DNA-binding transcriptional LysR family regulator